MAKIKNNIDLDILQNFGFKKVRAYGGQQYNYIYTNKKSCKYDTDPIIIKITKYGNIQLICNKKKIYIDKLFELAENNLLEKGKNHLTK